MLARPNLVPVFADGPVVGFRHDDIRRKSIYALCGIRSGDVWTKINGHSLATPEQMVELYPSLRHAEKVVIGLLRQGKAFEVEIALR